MQSSTETHLIFDLPPFVEREITHHRQRYSWDCGISCVLMALPLASREHLISNFNYICREEGFNKSTWTIDLCYLLKRYEVLHVFHTVTLGINPSYKEENFYDKIIDKDEGRIAKRFQEASEAGIKIHKSSLSAHDLMLHLANFGPVILLTNANLLHCHNCRTKKVARELLSCLPWPFEYHELCTISSEALDDARLSFGTDEDAVLVFPSGWAEKT